ncbi:hypothetical protein IWX75_003308 [Arthrobacter sp. CAN_A6]|uniref:hypothetical protein n=1 Tax=Arthrobacter sp. CAN_A6 TaxID=2787721 RepID=UPI0018C8E436
MSINPGYVHISLRSPQDRQARQQFPPSFNAHAQQVPHPPSRPQVVSGADAPHSP